MIFTLRRRLLVLLAAATVWLASASPALADIPSGPSPGTGLAVVAVIGLVGLVVLVGVGVLVVKLIARARRPAASVDAPAEPPKDAPAA
jgi:hypothetical protein